MSSATTFIAKPKNHQQKEALQAFMDALKITYETYEEQPYDPNFVQKVEESKAQYKKGQFTRIDKDDIDNFLGL